MLDDVHSESLAQLLLSVRPQQQLAVLPSAPLAHGDIIEIQGPHISGKSHLVYLLAITCILPPSHLDVIFGGWGQSAVVMDTDGSFSTSRFTHLLRNHISRLLPGAPSREQAIEEVFIASLARLHVFWPNSTSQLAATICHLPAHLASKYPYQEIGLIAIDSMSAFYWQDRFTMEQLRQLPTHIAQGANFPSSRSDSPLVPVLIALREILETHKPLTILVNWGLNKNASIPPAGGITLYSQHLRHFLDLGVPNNSDTSLPIALTHRITLGTSAIARIPTVVGHNEDVASTVIHAVVHKKIDVTDYFTMCIFRDRIEAH